MIRALRSIGALMLREMSTTYGRSAGGYIWAVLEPAAAVVFLTVVISVGVGVRVPALGQNFALFYASGMLGFMTYLRVSAKVGNCIPFSRALLNYPGVTWIDALLARYFLSMLTNMVVFSIVIGGLIAIFHIEVSINVSALALGVAMCAVLSLGIGTLMAYLFPVYPTIQLIWSILTAPLMLISGVLFLFDDLPQRSRDLLWFNPLIHVVGMVRSGFYPYYTADYVSPIYVFSIGMGCTLVGLLLLRFDYRSTYDN